VPATADIASAHPVQTRAGEILAQARNYLALTRPRVLTLVLLTAPPALALGHAGWPAPSVVLGVLVGAALVGGGCSALNAWYERDRDRRMERTRDRPLPAGRLTAVQALVFGVVVSAAGLAVLLATCGGLAAAVGALTLAHYLAVYTIWLKPRSPHNTVVGGVAGAAAPLIADAAVGGAIGPWGMTLFAIIFLWQPPHVWAITLYRREEYAAARFPMMPSAVGERATRRRMLAYAAALFGVTLLPWFGGTLGFAYLLTALAGGLLFLGTILHSMRVATPEADRLVFRVSIPYLGMLFAVMLVELLLR
jgi:protoheme IX farnesyltransferase